jgi:hypothetical protein
MKLDNIKKIVNKLPDIALGHTLELLNINSSLEETRRTVCLKCKLHTQSGMGEICTTQVFQHTDNNGEVISEDTLEQPINSNEYNVVSNEEDGNFISTHKVTEKQYRSGCGCRLAAKRRGAYMECPLRKWKEIDSVKLKIDTTNLEIAQEEIDREVKEIGIVRFAKKYNLALIMKD